MAVITEPGIATLSGPIQRRNDCERALGAGGFTVLPSEPLPEDVSAPPVPHRGLPSHRNPDEALRAGVPNAGHTPGTSHPETGELYEGDGRVAFVDVQIPETDGAVDEIARVAEAQKFSLRMHSAPRTYEIPDLTVEQRLERAEAHLAAIRQMQGRP